VSKGILSGVDAANRMASWTRYATGKCLQAVYEALGSHPSDRQGFYTYALRALETVPVGNRRYDRTPPKGAIVFFTAGGNGYGHICISVGGGNVVSTDIPSSGRVGITSIAAIEKAWGRRFLCWTNWVMGYDISTAEPAVTPPAPAPNGHDSLRGLPWVGIQRMLKSDFGYRGKIDNDPGTGTIAAFQRFLNAKGYSVRALGRRIAEDGDDGGDTLRSAQQWLKEKWSYVGKIDGDRGPGTTGAWGRAEAANGRAYAWVN